MAERTRIRFETHGHTGQHARVFVVTPDGEYELSCVTGVDLHLRVGELNSATLHILDYSAATEAEIDTLHVRRVRPRRRVIRQILHRLRTLR